MAGCCSTTDGAGEAQSAANSSCRCGAESSNPQPEARSLEGEGWFEGWIETPSVKAARVSTVLSFRDRLGTVRRRIGIGRYSYRVEPWLYAVGSPDADSPVLVSANYKMSFDALRSNLKGRDLWILVIDTKGINVWCAAGKGTFSAAEIARMVELTGLDKVVSHRRLILPQLSGSGVAAHELIRQTGFKAVFGPVRAADTSAFIDRGMEATPAMRRVNFALADRLVLTPIEFAGGLPILLGGAAIILLAAGLNRSGISFVGAWDHGWRAVLAFVGAFIAGAAITPVVLPWTPFRSFALKGSFVGLIWAAVMLPSSLLAGIGSLLILPAIAGYAALNFTGASTYTSPSGVRKELRYAIPAFIAAGSIGVGLIITQKIITIVSGG
ncbi:mercury methylation corrinoid protein HgcA [candidate division KSB1 bacterium]